jgi:hypothetical protein
MFGRQTRVELATIDEIVGAESCAQNQSGVRGFRGEKIESPRRAARALQAAIKA